MDVVTFNSVSMQDGCYTLGAESMSELGTFFTDAVPEPPATFATLAPANEAVGVATEFEFTWEE